MPQPVPRGWLSGPSLPAPAPASQGQRLPLPAVTCPPGRKLPGACVPMRRGWLHPWGTVEMEVLFSSLRS